MKRVSQILTVAIMVVLMLAVAVNAEKYSGTCGSDVAWTLDTETGVLTISGTGKMTSTGWGNYRQYITSAIIGEGVTALPHSVFMYCNSLKSVVIASTVESVGEYAFQYCESLETIEVADGNKHFCVDSGGVLFNIDKTTLVQYPAGSSNTAYGIPNTVTSISKAAFSKSKNLQYLTIPESVTTVGYYAFHYCSGLLEVTIPGSIEVIEDAAFDWCESLAKVTMCDGVKTIGASAFGRCTSLVEIVIPKTVTTIESGAFGGCTGLKRVYFEGDAPNISGEGFEEFTSNTVLYYTETATGWTDSDAYDADAGTWNGYTVDTWAGSNVEAVPDYSGTCGAIGNEENVQWVLHTDTGLLEITGTGAMMDGTYSGDQSTEMPWHAYANLIKNVSIADGITVIGARAFRDECNLTSIVIPDSVTYIGADAFNSCTGLETVEIGSGAALVDDIGFRNVFYGCTNLKNITVDENNAVLSSDEGILFNKAKTILIHYPPKKEGESYSIPETVTAIQFNAFLNNEHLENISIPAGVTFIDYNPFSGSESLLSITVDEGNECYKSVDGVLFNKNQTTLICYPSGKTNTSYEVPDAVNKVWPFAFYDNGALTSVVFPETLTEVGTEAFWNCSELKGLYFEGNAPVVGNLPFPANAVLYYTETATGWTDSDAYDADAGTWNGYTVDTWAGSNVEAVPDYSGTCGAIGNEENVQWVLHTDTGLLEITGTGAMMDYYFAPYSQAPWSEFGDSITSVVIGENITNIGSYAFYRLESLVSIKLGSAVTSIGDYAFSDCEKLSDENLGFGIELPASITSIGTHAFAGCTSLRRVFYLGDEPTVGSNAFLSAVRMYYDEERTSWTESNNYSEETGLWNGYTLNADSTVVIETFSSTLQSFIDIKTNELIISGEGEMKRLTNINSWPNYPWSPWSTNFSQQITDVFIGDGVLSLPDNVFISCTDIKNITIGSGLQRIDGGKIDVTDHFGLLSASIERITVSEDNRYFSSDACGVLFNKEKTILIQYPFASEITEYTIPDSVVSLEADAFRVCSNLEVINIPASLDSIGTDYLVLPSPFVESSLKEINVDEDNVYYSSKDGVLFNKDKTTLIQYPCAKDKTEYSIPNGVETLSKYAFWFCNNLEVINIPASFKDIGSDTLISPAESLKEINVDEDNVYYSSKDGVLFNKGKTILIQYPYANTRTVYFVPDGIETINAYSFAGNSLSKVVIPGSIRLIGELAFTNCANLSAVYFEGNAPTIVAYDPDADIFTESFPAETVLYYISGTTGWIESDAYDADAGTWNGYTLKELTLSGIDIAMPPTKTDYSVGDTLDTAGIVVSLSYGENSEVTKSVTEGFECSPSVLETAGTQTIAVTYQGKTATFDVFVGDLVKVSAETVKAIAGETVEVSISIGNNPGFAEFNLVISADKELTLTEIAAGELLTSESSKFTAYAPTGKALYVDTTNVIGNGQILKLTFAVADDALAGEYKISVGRANDSYGDFVDQDKNTIGVLFESGKIVVEEYVLGDIDNSGVVDGSDALSLARYMISLENFDKRAMYAADVNCDGVISAADSVRLAKYLVGIIETLEPEVTVQASLMSISESESTVIRVEKVKTVNPNKITVPVTIINNKGVAGLCLTVKADDGLTLTEVTKGSVFPTNENIDINVKTGEISWSSVTPITADGQLLMLTFEVSEEAAINAEYTIELTLKNNISTNFVDFYEKAIAVEIEKGSIEYVSAIMSEVSVSAEDVSFMLESSLQEDSDLSAIAAFYIDNKMVHCELVSVSTQNGNVTIANKWSEDYDEVRIFLLENHAPVCKSVQYNAG